MNLKDLKKLVKGGESDIVEFKASTSQLNRGVETLCAFLNKKGGVLLLGIKDDGEIIGEKITDNTKIDIANQINRIEPHPDIDTLFVPVSKGKEVVVLVAKPGANGPYVCNGRPYVRVQSTTKVMPQEEYKRILNLHILKTSWEGLTTNDCSINDLDKNLIRKVIDVAITSGRLTKIAERTSIPDILKKLKLLVNDRLTNAAVILFCKKEQKQFIQSNIKLARFKGTTKSEFLDSKVLCSNAFELYEYAMAFLEFNLPVAARIEEGKAARVETPAIPYKVLREALVNALCHKDYSIRGGSISVAIYYDRVEIGSTGLLPEGVKIKQLAHNHESILRNPLIANVFYLCHMIERWGRGTQEMIELSKKLGNPPPSFEEVTNSVVVTIPLKEPIHTNQIIVTPSPLLNLIERQKLILDILKHGPLSRKMIKEQMKDHPDDRVLQRDLLILKNLGFITREGRSRNIVWSLHKSKY
ncbi:MAG TPA: ATP-binding protein [Candidatus Babeliales bacterium]|jgi:ATP-dependent DNA helicase RecG|nr:ATP-binding protein [Candidatus Babeliales bacterium]